MSIRLSIILPSCNEVDLENTIKSLQESTKQQIEIIVVDDCSTLAIQGASIRNPQRLGATMSRQLGASKAQGEFLMFPDAHMRFPVGVLDRLLDIAAETKGFAYCKCNSSCGADLKLKPDGLLYAVWTRVTAPVRTTTAMMGANYVIHRDILDKMGGWVGLPGFLGSQELAMSIISERHGVPKTVDSTVSVWHEFRQNKDLPFESDIFGFKLNIACVFRLLFSDETWHQLWKPRVAAVVGKQITEAAESPMLVDYGKQLRSLFTVSEESFIQRFTQEA